MYIHNIVAYICASFYSLEIHFEPGRFFNSSLGRDDVPWNEQKNIYMQMKKKGTKQYIKHQAMQPQMIMGCRFFSSSLCYIWSTRTTDTCKQSTKLYCTRTQLSLSHKRRRAKQRIIQRNEHNHNHNHNLRQCSTFGYIFVLCVSLYS